MQEFEIRVRFSSSANPQSLIFLAEAIEDLVYERGAEDEMLSCTAGLAEESQDWQEEASDTLNEFIDRRNSMQKVFN